MKYLLTTLSFLPLIFTSSLVLEIKDNSNTQLLDIVKSADIALVEFYATWCGHCKNLAPHYEQAAKELENTNRKLVKVECTENAELCGEYGVQGYPTLIGMKKSEDGTIEQIKFPDVERKAPQILAFLEKCLAPPITHLATEEEAKEVAEPKLAVHIVAATDNEKDQKLILDIAAAFRKNETEAFFYSINSTEVAKAIDMTKLPAIHVFKTFDEKKNVYEGSFEFDEIATFLNKVQYPVMEVISPATFPRIIGSGKPIGYYFIDMTKPDYENEEIKAIAKKYKEKVNLVYIDAATFGKHAETVSIPTTFPSFGLADYTASPPTKWPLQKSAPTPAEIEEHVKQVVEGKMDPFLLSEEVPEENSQPVKIVVGKTFNDIVYDTKKDVFLEIYATWCGHCKALAPVWEQLGKAYANATDVIIAKVNGADNDIPQEPSDIKDESNVKKFFDSSFPTLLMIRAGDNKVFKCEGERDLKSLMAFVESNAANKGQGLSIEELEEEENAEEKASSEDGESEAEEEEEEEHGEL